MGLWGTLMKTKPLDGGGEKERECEFVALGNQTEGHVHALAIYRAHLQPKTLTIFMTQFYHLTNRNNSSCTLPGKTIYIEQLP